MKNSLNSKLVDFMQSSKLQSSDKFMQPCHNVETDFVGGGGGEYLSSYSHFEGLSPYPQGILPRIAQLFANDASKESSLCFNPKVGLPHRSAPRNDRAAFTLAEVLITLGVIGIVAAMTMPLLINNYRVKYLENRFKKSSVILETALNDTMQEFALEVLLKTMSNLKYVNYRISDTERKVINDYFKSRFTDVQTRNMNQVWNINCYSKSGALLGTYGGGLTFSQNTSYPRELWLLPDGMSITPINFQEHNIYDGLKVILDTNGPYKGPNRYGYDVFVYDSGNFAVDVCADEAKNIMSIYGCYNYAKANQNPNDSTKEYWESLK